MHQSHKKLPPLLWCLIMRIMQTKQINNILHIHWCNSIFAYFTRQTIYDGFLSYKFHLIHMVVYIYFMLQQIIQLSIYCITYDIFKLHVHATYDTHLSLTVPHFMTCMIICFLTCLCTGLKQPLAEQRPN